MDTLKKTCLNLLTAVLMLSTLMFIVTGCSKDDDPDTAVQVELLLGSWELIREDGFTVDYTLIATFLENGGYGEFFQNDFTSYTETGTWSLLGSDRARIDYGGNDFSDFVIITLTGSRLLVEDLDEETEFEFEKI